MQCHPRTALRPERCCHIHVLWSTVAVHIRIMVTNGPAAAVHDAGGVASVFRHFFDQIKEGAVQFTEVGDLCGPVVHLCVDVDGVFRIPRRNELEIPDALQVESFGIFTPAGQEEIAAESEVQSNQSVVVVSCFQTFHTLVEREWNILTQIKLASAHQMLEVRDMAGKQGFVAFGFRTVENVQNGRGRIIGTVGSRRSQQKDNLIGIPAQKLARGILFFCFIFS